MFGWFGKSNTGSSDYPPPWRKLTEVPAEWPLVARRRAIASSPFVAPRLYGQESFPPASGQLPDRVFAPELELREASGLTLLPRRVVVSRSLGGVLPHSFNRLGHDHHGGLRKGNGRFYPLEPESFAPSQKMGVPLYLADTPYPDIHGHFLLEVLPQLWGLAEARKGTKVATSVPMNAEYLKMFEVLGVPRRDIVPIKGPVVAGLTLLPAMPLMLRDYVHPAAFEMFDRLSRLGLRSDTPIPERLYVSRSTQHGRRLENEAEVEAMFEAAGFTIYHPEIHPIEDQIRVFSRARLIAGPGGSGVHNAVFAPHTARVLIIQSARWFTIIDPLLNQVDGRLGLVFGEAVDEDTGLKPAVARWRVDPERVRHAARAHFEIEI